MIGEEALSVRAVIIKASVRAGAALWNSHQIIISRARVLTFIPRYTFLLPSKTALRWTQTNCVAAAVKYPLIISSGTKLCFLKFTQLRTIWRMCWSIHFHFTALFSLGENNCATKSTDKSYSKVYMLIKKTLKTLTFIQVSLLEF